MHTQNLVQDAREVHIQVVNLVPGPALLHDALLFEELPQACTQASLHTLQHASVIGTINAPRSVHYACTQIDGQCQAAFLPRSQRLRTGALQWRITNCVSVTQANGSSRNSVAIATEMQAARLRAGTHLSLPFVPAERARRTTYCALHAQHGWLSDAEHSARPGPDGEPALVHNGTSGAFAASADNACRPDDSLKG
jgi:hypothetical protein